MKRKLESIQDEEIELEDFVDTFFDHPYREKYLDAFLRNKLDPREKIVIQGYDEYNDKIITDKLTDNSNFIGRRLKKVKLQARLESERDVVNLINYLNNIIPALRSQSDEETINESRKKILKEILDEPPVVDFFIPKIKCKY